MMLELPSKLAGYLSGFWKYSVFTQYTQVVLAINPAIFRFIDGKALWLLLGVLLSSVLNYRLFHIFFVLVVLKARLPGFEDKKFWGTVVLFTAIDFMWAYLHWADIEYWLELI